MAATDDLGAAQIAPAQDPSHAPLVRSPKNDRDVASSSAESAGFVDAEVEDREEEQVVQRRPRPPHTRTSSWLGDFFEESGKLLHAPPDLFIVYSIKVAECTAYYGISYVYTHYLTEEFGMTDQQAGNLYALYGLLCTVIGILMGVSIDRLGVRKALILGCVCNLVARIIAAYTTSVLVVWLTSVTLMPLGAAFSVPALALGVRRFTHESNRAFAFTFFYMALCFACLLSSVIINRVRNQYIDGVVLMGYHWSWMRIVVCWCAVITAYCVAASCFVRDIQVRSDKPLEEQAYEKHRGRGRTNLREIFKQRRFWRVVGVTFIFCGIRMAFRHLDATFPKYYMRTHGRQAPFEVIVAFEPLVTMLVSPIATLALVKLNFRIDQALLCGAFISGLSVFILSLEETWNSAMAFVTVLAIGEAIWSPKLYEFSTMAAPEGREGIFVAITFAPVYLASVPVGWLSGWALTTFCSRDAPPEERQGQLMWFIIGCTSFSSFVLMWMCRGRLFPSESDDEADEQGQDGEDSL